MTLAQQLTDYIHAAFSGLWIQSFEPDEAEREIARLANERNWRIAVWDVANGLRLPAELAANHPDAGIGDPLAPLKALPLMAAREGTALLILHHFHRFLTNPEVIQALISRLIAGKQQRTFVVVLSPVVQLPIELEKLFVVIEHALPDRDQLLNIARELTADNADDLPTDDDRERLLDAAAGLTRYEAEGAFSLSLARHNSLRPEALWELKAQALKKNNLLTLHRGTERFDDLGGLGGLKEFCRKALRPSRNCRPMGILALGVPGSGKSAFAKALGNEIGRPTLLLDLGALYGSLVGATEQNIRQALRVADAMTPAIIFIDEIEKALGGIGSTGDSGVSTRLFGTFLTWLSDHTSDVFVVATANDISKLPPEFARAERFDGIFFLDLPTRAEKDVIWSLYRRQFVIAANEMRPDDAHWTGAEIRACCRLATLLEVTLTEAARHVVPVAVTAAEQVDKLRTWASGRCLSASTGNVYQRATEMAQQSRRVQRDPTRN